MSGKKHWSTEDFESLSWHDVHVHGFRFYSYEQNEGCADLLLDIDYILMWHESGAGFEFTLCPAILRFNKVFGIQMMIDYAQVTAGMCPFSIQSIERQVLGRRTGCASYNWQILLNWPNGYIKFEASGFTQTLTGTPRRGPSQWLRPTDRL